MKNTVNTSIITAIAAAALVYLAVTAIALADGHHRPAQRHVSRAVVAHADALQEVAQLAPHVAVLRIVPGPSDIVSDKLAGSALMKDGVADVGLARRVGVSKPAWFLPGSDGKSICVLTPASLSCPLSKDVEDHGLAPSIFWTAQGPIRILGIASDFVTSVDIVREDGTVDPSPVTNNLLDFASEDPPREIRWRGPDGVNSVRVPEIKGR